MTGRTGDSLGQRLRGLRKARGWKQQTLAEKAGISQHYLSEIETGTRQGKLDVLEALARALGVSVSALLEAPAEDGHGELPGLDDLSPRLAAVVRRLGRFLSPRDWERLARLAEDLAAERAEASGAAYGYQVPEAEQSGGQPEDEATA